MPEEISIEYAEKMNECIDVLLGAQDTVVDATQAVSEARREIDEAKKQMLEAPQIAAEAMAQAEAANSAAIDANAAAHAASETANSAKSQAEANAAEIASVKSQTETVVNEMGQAIGAMATSMTETAEKAEANEAAIAAVQATADAAATQTALAEVKETADAALPKSGGEMTGDIIYKINNYTFGTPPAASLYSGIIFRDKNSAPVGAIQNNIGQSGSNDIRLIARMPTDNTQQSIFLVGFDQDGTAYATCPPPRSDNYGNDIVNMKAMKDYAPMKLPSNINIYVNADTGSDTADLFAGRGFSTDKPFKTLDAAIHYVQSHLLGVSFLVTIVLQTDVTVGRLNIWLANINYLLIRSDSIKRTIITTNGFYLYNGCINYQNVKIISTEDVSAVWYLNGTTGNPMLRFMTDVEIDGMLHPDGVVIDCSYNSVVVVNNAVTGSVAGKKYSCTNGGMIIGASKIPGTEAGTCDANSKAFG